MKPVTPLIEPKCPSYSTHNFIRLCIVTLLGAALAGCRPAAHQAAGVELVMSSEVPAPGMTFELRFDSAMVPTSEIGVTATNSPLLITPPLAGTFTWLSQRSGTFTPDEALALDTRYELSLRPRLTRADGQPAGARLHWEVTTPPFGMVGASPHRKSRNAFSEPEIKLLFNADVSAADAQGFLCFRNAAGEQVAAEARQATMEDGPSSYEFERIETLDTWQQQFAKVSHPGRSRHRVEEVASTNEVGNVLIVKPQHALPLGKDWELVISTGLPARDRFLRLPARAAVPIGDVTPFIVTGVTADNFINAGPTIRIKFSKAVSSTVTNNISDWLQISPVPTNLTVELSDRELTLTGAFRGNDDYEITLRPGFPAEEDFKLAGSNEFSVSVPPIPPRLYFPACESDQLAGGNRAFPLLGVNVPAVRVRAKLMQPQTAIHALRGYRSYFRTWEERYENGERFEPYQQVDYNLVPGRTVFDEQLDLNPPPDTEKRLDLGWDQLLRGRRTGVVFLDARQAGGDDREKHSPGTQALIQLTDLGLVWKKGKDGMSVFVFSHSTGKPVGGATAQLFSDENESLGAAITDTNGMAHLIASTNADWVAVQQGEDFHAMALRENEVRLHSFELQYTGSDEQEDTRRVMMFSDRNLYRPGEELHLAALVRDWNDRGLVVPTGLTGSFQCVDARGRQFFQTNAVFNASGSWSALVPLPTASRGAYSALLHLGTNDYSYAFQVQDFQPSAFEVALQPKPVFAADEKIKVPVSAKYLFGKPLSRAQVKWSLEAEDREFQAKGFEGFSFRRTDWDSQPRPGGSALALNGQETLLAASNCVLSPDLPVNPAAPQPRAASLLVEVTDLNQQTISRQTEFVRHSSDFYLGLRQGAAVLTSSNPVTLEVVAVRADGQPWPETVKARLVLQHIEWQPVRVQGAGRSMRYHTELVRSNLFEEAVEVQPIQMPTKPDEAVVADRLTGLPALPAGQYAVELQTEDPGGRPVMSSLSFQVSALGEMGWNYRNDVQLTLKPEREVHAPGETAEILVEAPFSGTALVTVEREKVLRSFVARLEGNAPSIKVPLEPGDVPNVFVNVTLVRGSDDCPRKIREPEYRVGYCELPVADPQTLLKVLVMPGATNYLPGRAVELAVQVADAKGQPVSGAEVVLYAVDDGILSLTDYGLPNPYGFFYATRPLGVQSSVSLPNLLAEDPEDLRFENKGYLGGGGGKNRVRKNFLACAYWNAALTTDSDGRTSAHFPAPDSLTRYRVFAVAHTTGSRFGSGESAFRVNKPLVLEPALPSFANISDHLVARGLVQNQTANGGEVIVTLTLDDKAKDSSGAGNLTQHLLVAPKGSAVAEFPVEFTGAGEAKWVWTARFAEAGAGDYTDAVESRIAVGQIAPMLREILFCRIADGATNLLAEANPQLLAGNGTITVWVANTRLNELGEAASQLLHYPYGCAEQTGSSLLPWIVLHDMPGLFPLLRRGTNDMAAAIQTGIARFLSMQTESGGLGYWPRAKEPMLWASAYGGMVLALAQRHGVEVPKQEFAALLKYLSQQLRSIDSEPSNLSDYCLVLYALAVAGQPEPAYHEKIFALRGKLCPEDRALLALAIAESHGLADMIGQLLDSTETGRQQIADPFGCAAREQAIRLLAWVHYQPENPIVDELVSSLMREQKQAHWGTTQGDAWALLALTEYARRVEGALRPAEGQLCCEGLAIPLHLNSQTNIFTQSFAVTNLAAKALTLRNDSDNRLYASVLIEARPPATQQPRQDRGFGLSRQYDRLDDENQPQDLHGLRVGDRVLVTLRLSVRDSARYVAIDDALPSILEAVNPEFKTQQARSAGYFGVNDSWWASDFQELRKDRCLTFADWVSPGNYTWRYVARVRAAGKVTAPSAKVEEMYYPERYGLSGTQIISSGSLP